MDSVGSHGLNPYMGINMVLDPFLLFLCGSECIHQQSLELESSGRSIMISVQTLDKVYLFLEQCLNGDLGIGSEDVGTAFVARCCQHFCSKTHIDIGSHDQKKKLKRGEYEEIKR